ncbi:hypothetical protein ACA910_021806 [Epithemia clementina (nom. ined.)]
MRLPGKSLAKLFFSVPKLLEKHNPVHWLCAQKRPFDGFIHMMQKYYDSNKDNNDSNQPSSQTTSTTISTTPHCTQTLLLRDYLIVVDDDTWLNLDLIVPQLTMSSPSTDAPTVVAGCMIYTSQFIPYFSFPYGGFGIFLSRPALERLFQPLHCHAKWWPTYATDDQNNNNNNTTTTDWSSLLLSSMNNRKNNNKNTTTSFTNTLLLDDPDRFEELACRRIWQNGIGERDVYRQEDGQTLAELMHAYVVAKDYANVRDWNQSAGFCLHSDMAWGYFLNYYFLAQPPPPAKNSHDNHNYNHNNPMLPQEKEEESWSMPNVGPKGVGRKPRRRKQQKQQQRVRKLLQQGHEREEEEQQQQRSEPWSFPHGLVGYNQISTAHLYDLGSEQGQCRNGNDARPAPPPPPPPTTTTTDKHDKHNKNNQQEQQQQQNKPPSTNGDAHCTIKSHICHRITPQHMHFLHAQQQGQRQQQREPS